MFKKAIIMTLRSLDLYSMVFTYLLYFNTKTMRTWWELYPLKEEIKARRQSMPRRISASEMESVFI